jgi:hypothetical protein
VTEYSPLRAQYNQFSEALSASVHVVSESKIKDVEEELHQALQVILLSQRPIFVMRLMNLRTQAMNFKNPVKPWLKPGKPRPQAPLKPRLRCKELRSLAQSMAEISGSAKKISDITNVIDDIAFQTNLLALNQKPGSFFVKTDPAQLFTTRLKFIF